MITKDGRDIPLKAVGRRFVDQVMVKYQTPTPPTYEAHTVGGGVEVHPHDEKSAKNTPGALELWQAYQEDKRKVIADRHQAVTEFLIYNCIDLEPTPTAEWHVDLGLFGLETPDSADKVRYKVFWVENELVPDPDDQAKLMAELYALGGIIGEDSVTEFERFFRLALARVSSGGPGSPAASRSANSRTKRRKRDV